MKPTHRYLVLIAPSPAITEQVVRMRERLHARIGPFTGRLLMPHVTLLLADLPEALGTAVALGVEEGVRHAQPFALHYAGITHFPDRRTIYIDPVEKEAIAYLRLPLVAAVRAQEAVAPHVRATEHPHLTIAAGLKPAQFAEAWPMLAPHAFNGEHVVRSVLLLRRELLPGATYAVVRKFPFGG
jgi:2'-5' RNA ligase